MQKHLFWSAMLQLISKRFFYAIIKPPRILKATPFICLLYFMDAKYITTASEEPILSWVTMYTVRLSVISCSNAVKVKVVI